MRLMQRRRAIRNPPVGEFPLRANGRDGLGLHTGTACLVLPDTVGDRFRLSPWKQFLHARNVTGKEPAIFITGARVAVAVVVHARLCSRTHG